MMVSMPMSCSYVELSNCYFIYTKYINIFFPYDVFWLMEPVPSNQSMENYTGEYVLIGHNVQSLYFISQPPWQSSSISSHLGFDTARRLHATSKIPNKRTKLSNNMKKHDAINACNAKETHQKISKQIKLKWKYNKNAFNKEYTILKVRKEENKYECRKRC